MQTRQDEDFFAYSWKRRQGEKKMRENGGV